MNQFGRLPRLGYHAPMFWLLLLACYVLVLGVVAWKRRNWLLDALVPALLGAFTLAFFWRLVSGDAYMPADGGDLGSFLFPMYSFIQRSLHAGVWPLWNPHIYSGVPFVAEVQSGILYPPHLLRFLLGPALTYADMQWLAMLHIWWAGVTSYLLARGLNLRRGPAVLVAVAFMFSDLFIVHFGNLNLIAVASWLPLALLGVHLTLERRRWWPALGAGLAVGIGGMAGHIQMTLFCLMAILLWVGLWLLLTRGGDRQRWRWAALAVLAPSFIAIGLLAPIILPGLELSRLSARAEWAYTQAVEYSLSPAQLIGLVIPGFFGRGPAFHWGLWPRVEIGYVGVLTLVLAMIGVVMRRDRRTWLLLGLAALALAFSLGIYSALHGWLTWLLPGLEQLRAPARFIVLFDLAVALLAGIGLQAMLNVWDENERADFDRVWRLLRTIFIVALAVGIPVIYAVLLLTQQGDATVHLRVSVATIAVVSFVVLFGASLALLYARRRDWLRPATLTVLAVALVLLDLASLGAYQDLSETDPANSYDRPALLEFLRADPDLFRIDARTDIDAYWQPDAALLHGLYDIWGVVNPLTLTYYDDYLEATGSRSSDLYALLNVKYLLGRKDVVLDWDVWELAFDGDPDLNVYRNRRFTPRAQLLGTVRNAEDLAAAQAIVSAADFQPLTETVIEGGTEQTGPGGNVQIVSFDSNDVLLSTDSTGPGALRVAQTWYPGWQASVDGGAWQPMLRADGVWQAVQLPAGQHTVQLRFRSQPWTLGLGVAGLTLAVVLALLIWRIKSKT